MYGLIVSFSIITCSLLIERQIPINQRNVFWKLVFFMIIGGIVGARAYHVIHLSNYYLQDSLKILYIWNGGLGIFGGIIGALISFLLIAKKEKLDSIYWLDKMAFFAPLAQSIGRIANIINKELLPYAIYESISLFVVFIVFITFRKQITKRGVYASLYLISYGLIRIILEPTKQDAWVFGNIYVSYIFAILFISVGGLKLYECIKK